MITLYQPQYKIFQNTRYDIVTKTLETEKNVVIFY